MWGWIKKQAGRVGRGLSGLVDTVLQGVGWLGHRSLGLPELLASYLGLRWRKRLGLTTIILKDAAGLPIADIADVQRVVKETTELFRRSMNIRIQPADGSREIVKVFAAQNPSYVLTPKCDVGGFKHFFTRVGRWFRRQTVLYTRAGGVCMFVVEDVQGKEKNGCFMFLSDYGNIDPDALIDAVTGGPADVGVRLTFAHELGHASDLFHRDDPLNLMAGDPKSRTGRLTRWQRAVIRSSRHVRYFQR